jgi:predicted nuclease with TOPRIM domain
LEQKIWYIEINGQRQGPFIIDELLEKGLRDYSLVWKAGMENWVVAKEIPEMAAAFNWIKIKNEIEIDAFKFMTDENADFRSQIEQLEKNYEELQDEKLGIKAILKANADKDAELRPLVGLLKNINDELLILKMGLTVELKALESENVKLRSKLKQIFAKLVRKS